MPSEAEMRITFEKEKDVLVEQRSLGGPDALSSFWRIRFYFYFAVLGIMVLPFSLLFIFTRAVVL